MNLEGSGFLEDTVSIRDAAIFSSSPRILSIIVCCSPSSLSHSATWATMIVSVKTYLSWSFTCVARVERCLYKSFWKTSPKFSKNWIFLISQHLFRIMTDPAVVRTRYVSFLVSVPTLTKHKFQIWIAFLFSNSNQAQRLQESSWLDVLVLL